MIHIDGDEISISIDLDQGARLASVQWQDLEFCVPDRGSTINWGWYAMAPWAGRVRDGALKDKNGNYYALPTNFTPPHAIHGFGPMGSWAEIGKGRARLELPAPYNGAYVDQTFEILDDALRWTLEYEANGCEMPIWMGMHPWFPRELERGGEAELEFYSRQMFERVDGLPTGNLISPSAQPWDDCFTDLQDGPSLVIDGVRVDLSSSCNYWVVYNESPLGWCIEPQSGPPNAFNTYGESSLDIVGPARVLQHSFTWRISV